MDDETSSIRRTERMNVVIARRQEITTTPPLDTELDRVMKGSAGGPRHPDCVEGDWREGIGTESGAEVAVDRESAEQMRM